MSLSKKRKTNMDVVIILLEVGVAIIWIVQFSMLIGYRYSQTGRVCSGDFSEDELVAENIQDRPAIAQDKYAKYFLKQEGLFFYHYTFACLILFVIVLMLVCCFGTCLFMVGFATVLKFIEKIVMDLENLPSMIFKGKKADAAKREKDRKDGRTDEEAEN